MVSRMPIFQSAMRESTISIAGSANSTARSMSAMVRLLVVEIAPEHEGDLRLDLRLDQPRRAATSQPSGTAMSANSMP